MSDLVERLRALLDDEMRLRERGYGSKLQFCNDLGIDPPSLRRDLRAGRISPRNFDKIVQGSRRRTRRRPCAS